MNQLHLFTHGERVCFACFARDEVKVYGEGPFVVRSVQEVTSDLCACGMLVTNPDHLDERGARIDCPHGMRRQLLLMYTDHPQWVVIEDVNGKFVGGYFGTYFRAAETEVA